MPDRYQSLFGASRPALDPALAGPEWVEEGIFLVNRRTGERRLKQIPGGERATTAVPVPDTSLTAIAKEALGLAGATAGEVNVSTVRNLGQAPIVIADVLKRGAESLDPKSRQKKGERADAYMKLFGTPGAAEAVEASRKARELKLDPLRPAAELTAGWTEGARERLAEATQDLPTLAAVGIHQGATMAGMLADPTVFVGAGKAPRPLSEAAQEAAINLAPRKVKIGGGAMPPPSVESMRIKPGPPGISVSTRVESEGWRVQEIAYRRSDGRPIGGALIEVPPPGEGPARIGAFAVDKGAGLARGKAAVEIGREIARMGALDIGMLTDDSANFVRHAVKRAAREDPEVGKYLSDFATRYPQMKPSLLRDFGESLKEIPKRANETLQRGYGRVMDMAEADAVLRDKLNRLPGYRKAYYEDRLDDVEVGLQRLREADDAAPTPPYFRQGDRAPEGLPADRFAPPGPEARGATASPPFRGQVADSPPSPPHSGLDDAVASPPLGPRPGSGEAGFVKLRPDALSPADEAAKEAAWQMRKEYAATERLGRYRAGTRAEELQKLIPKETDEALTWMFHEMGDPRSYANRPPAVQARIAKKVGARRRVIERVLADPNAEPALQEVVSWREQTKQMWDELSDMWDLGFVKNYVHMTYEPPKGVKTVNPMSFGSVGTTPGLVRERSFLNPAEAMAAGWTPRTLRFSRLRAETEKVFAHAQAIRGLVDDLATMPLLQDGRPALTYATTGKQPKGYIRVSGVPVLERAAQRSPSSARALPEAVRHAELLQAESRRAAETAGGFFRYTPEGGAAPSVIEQPMLPGTEGLGPRTFRPPRTPTTPGDLWVHPQIWEELKPVLDVAEPLKIDRFLGTVKRIKFLGSIFHPFELGLAAMQSMGPVKGAKAWASRGGGLPGLAQLAERRGWATPFTQEVAEKWVRRGLGVEAPSADMMTDAFQRAMVDWEDLMTRAAGKAGAVARAAGAAGKGLRVTANYYDEAIWKILHSPLKIAAAEQWEAQLKAARAGDRGALGVANRFLTDRTRGRLAAMTDEEIGEAVASGINNHFGGQVWELSRNRLFSDPRALKWMRRIFLSPDWNVSAISSGLSPLSSDPVHRIIGRTYWTNITALAAGFSVLNYALTAGSEQGPHFPWENEEGHRMDLETPFRTDKGRKIFYRVGKHAQELPHLAFGTPGAQQLRFIAGKTSPIVHAAAGLMGESVTEFPSPLEELVREREKTGEVPGPVEEIAARLQPAAEMMLPFSAQDAEDPGDVLRKLLISIPESKGMSTYKAENLYAQALYDNDQPRLAEIVEILRQNGYDDEAIGFMIQGAKRKVKRRLRVGR